MKRIIIFMIVIALIASGAYAYESIVNSLYVRGNVIEVINGDEKSSMQAGYSVVSVGSIHGNNNEAWTFSDVEVGQEITARIKVTNTGNTNINLRGAGFSVGDGQIVSDVIPQKTLSPGDTDYCGFTIKFTDVGDVYFSITLTLK